MQEPSRPATGYPAPPYANGGQPPPHGTAYPYAAPPPYPQQPQYYNPNPYPYPYPNRSYASRSFFRAFIATMICLLVVFGVILIIVWLVVRPSLPHFQLDTLSVTNFSTTTQSLTATWHIGFLVRNGNKKMTITYNALRPAVFYKSQFLADSRLAPFKLDTKSQTTLNATLAVDNSYVEPHVVDDINSDRQRGSVPFDVQVLASTSFRSGSWRFRSRMLKVLCRNVPVGISSRSTSGNLVGGSRECQVWT